MKKQIKIEGCFTIIELLAATAIIAILAGHVAASVEKGKRQSVADSMHGQSCIGNVIIIQNYDL
jgi:prepilin-type N-terminal cleavage/methylation domain-containing protein